MNDAAERRLRWHCRRGMQELDLLLARYLDDCWATAPGDERRVFASFLDLPDPQLEGYLLKGEVPATPEFAVLANRIRGLAAAARASGGRN